MIRLMGYAMSLSRAAVAGLMMLLAGVLSAEIRIGIVGTDTSHALQFAKLLQGDGPDRVSGARIVAAYKGGSPDIPNSANRVDGFAAELASTYGVALCETIEEVVAQADAIMILSLDGRRHLEQARKVFPSGKPVFVDKPVAASVADAVTLFDLAREQGVPCFSASLLRFGPGMEKLRSAPIGRVQGAFSYGPAAIEPHHPDLFWYGIHSVEALYAVMGTGCVKVTRSHTPDADIVTGTWADGRTGTIRGNRNGVSDFGLIVFGTKAIAVRERGRGYAPLLQEIVRFFQTGTPPVSAEEAIEVLAFMEAADESKRRDGIPVELVEVMPPQSSFRGEHASP